MNGKTVLQILFATIAAALIISACSPATKGQGPKTTELPTPTLNPFFHPATLAPAGETPPGVPTSEQLLPAALSTGAPPAQMPSTAEGALAPTLPAAASPTATMQPSETPTPEPTSTETPTPTEAYKRIMVFDEGLNEYWAVKYSQQMKFNERDKTVAHAGATSLSFTPLADYGTLLFSVRQTSKENYLRKDAVGVSFWLYSDQEIAPSDLTVSILGSNRFAFWIKDDHSVTSDQQPVFPETRLYYLDINNSIPPKTWVQIEVWLDDLIYEPEYQYITGIQIKNDAGFLNTVYIDQVELLMNLTQP